MRLALLALVVVASSVASSGCLRPACIKGDCSSFFEGVHETRASVGPWEMEKARAALVADNATIDVASGPGITARWRDGVRATLLAEPSGKFTLDLEALSPHGIGQLRSEVEAQGRDACAQQSSVFARHAATFANATGWSFVVSLPCAALVAVT